MPVLGSSATSSGVVGSGYGIPYGSLDTWRAARDNAAAELVEVPIFGDSTTFGSGSSTGGWIRKLRDLALAAGFTDGGRGVGSAQETAASSGEALAPLVSKTGFAGAASNYDFLSTDTLLSTTAGDTATFTGKGTALRIQVTRVGTGGAFTYSVDGGAAQNGTSLTANTVDMGTYYVGGLSEGTHTVTITNTSGGRLGVNVEWFRAAGLVFHKQAISGISSNTFFDTTKSTSAAFPNANSQAAFGLTTGIGSANSQDWSTAQLAKPASRRPKLAIFALGINDQQGANDTNITTQLTYVTEGAGLFCRLARQAGADPLIVIPHYTYANGSGLYSARFRQAHLNVAMAHGAAWCDFNVALGPIGSSGFAVGAPHLSQAAYDAEATFLWNKLLSV